MTGISGCPCGCTDRDECITNRAAHDVDGHCCGQLSLDELAQASQNGWNCWRKCVAKRLAGIES